MPDKTLSDQLIPWMPLIGAFGGALITGLIAITLHVLNKKAEERRHLRELMFNAAVENWKQSAVVSIELMKAGQNVEMMPLDAYIVNLITLSNTLLSTKLTKENITSKLKEAYEISDVADKFIKDNNSDTKE